MANLNRILFNITAAERHKKKLVVTNSADIFDHLQRASSLEEVMAVAMIMRSFFGYSMLSFGQFCQPVDATQSSRSTIVLANDEFRVKRLRNWAEYYLAHLIQEDPILSYARTHISPAIVDKSSQFSLIEQGSLKMANAFRDFGIQQFLAVPIHASDGTYYGLRLGNTDGTALSLKDMTYQQPILIGLSSFLAEKIRKYIQPSEGQSLCNNPTLSNREKDVLCWIARGKTSSQISDVLRISESTVATYMKRIHTKLEVKTRQHAVAKAMSLGIIEV